MTESSWPPDPADYDSLGYDPATTADDCDRLLALAERHAIVAPRFLDLASGTGRHARELARRDHQVVAVDRNVRWLAHAQGQDGDLGRPPLHLAADLRDLPFAEGSFDIAFCLFNTLMELVANDVALGLFRGAARVLRTGGLLVIDDFPAEMWPEIAEGNWVTGVAEEHGSQMLWEPGENTFALRRGAEVDVDDWTIRPTDRLYRMWSRRDIRLLALVAGLDEVEATPDLVFRKT